jgi:hypothetical protein
MVVFMNNIIIFGVDFICILEKSNKLILTMKNNYSNGNPMWISH